MKMEGKIKKLKKLCLNKQYCCSGEIYKILDNTSFKKIIIDNIGQLNEENFLLILDKYIGYVRDNYSIRHYELVLILVETLKNNYNKCFLEKINIHNNLIFFSIYFKKIFLENIYNNTLKYGKNENYNKLIYLKEAYNFLENKSLENETDLKKIENYFINIINNRKENLYNCFKINKNIEEKKEIFYANQLNWLYEDYYKNNNY